MLSRKLTTGLGPRDRLHAPWTTRWNCNSHCNRNLHTSKAPLESQMHGAILFTSAATNQRGCPSDIVQRKLRSDFQRVREDRVAVKAGVV